MKITKQKQTVVKVTGVTVELTTAEAKWLGRVIGDIVFSTLYEAGREYGLGDKQVDDLTKRLHHMVDG